MNCYKCGRETGNSNPECDSCAGGNSVGHIDCAAEEARIAAAIAEAILNGEMLRGHEAFEAAAEHVHHLGADACHCEHTIEGTKYLVVVKRI